MAIEEKSPVTCLYCGEPIGPTERLTLITQTSLDEEGVPDLEAMAIAAAAHPGCWEREGPPHPSLEGL